MIQTSAPVDATPQGVIRPRTRSKTRSSRLEAKFALYWRSLGGPALETEFVFHPQRKWRADFAHLASRTLIEIEGGIFIAGGGRHNRTAGFIADAEKYLEAFLAGWNVVRLTQAQITAPNIERLVRRVTIDSGMKEYGHSSSTSPPRSDAHEHERVKPHPEHP